MNSTNPFLNNTHAAHLANSYQTFETNMHNITFLNNQTTKVIESKKIKSNFTDPKYDNIPRSKRHHISPRKINFEIDAPNVTLFNNQTVATNKTHSVSLQSQRSLSLSTGPSGFEELMNQIDINNNGSAHGDPEKDIILKSLQGLEGQSFYSGILTDGKNTVDRILTKLKSLQPITEMERDWEDLAKALQVIHEYQRDRYHDSKSIDDMKGSLRNLAQLFSNTPITTKAQFLAFKNWISIASLNLSNEVGFNNFDLTSIYLMKLSEVLSSSDRGIQDLVHTYSNSLFVYQFIKTCSNINCTVKEGVLTAIQKTFDLVEKKKGESSYYFARNALMSFEKVLKNSKQLSFQHEFITKIEQGFEGYLANLTPKEKTIVKQLSYLTIKSIQEQNITALSPFAQKTTVRDLYPYQKEISIGNMKVNTTSALNWNHHLMQNLSGKLQETYSLFIEKFGSVLNVSAQEVKSNLYIAKDKESYEIFNYILIGKSTGNGGITECDYDEERSCIPSAAMYTQGDEIWNLEHEFNHVLLHLYAGLKVNHQMNTFEEYGRLDWLNEGLAYVLVPNNFMETSIERVLISKGLPSIKSIIEAPRQDYALSYSLVDYLLNRQKPVLDRILVYTKNEKKDLLKEELKKLSSLESEYQDYLMTRWNLPGNIPKSTTITKPQSSEESTTLGRTTVGLITAQHAITENLNHSSWTPEEGWNAVKKITYGSTGLLGAAITCLVFGILRITQQKGGNGRGGHNRFKAESRKGYCHNPAKHSEIKPLRKNQKQTQFFRHDSRSSQRQENAQV